MVAKHNIEKFADNPSKLDKKAISRLSIDALSAVQGSNIIIIGKKTRDCKQFSNYHFGYCSKLNKYKDTQYKEYDESKVREVGNYDRG
jgi:hypothetical protein